MVNLSIVIVICLLIGYLARQYRCYKQEKPEYECEHHWETIDKVEYVDRDIHLLKCNICGKLHKAII